MSNMQRLSMLASAAERAESADLAWAGIFAPDFGEHEDIPNILIPEAYTVENRNVLLMNGEIQRMKMRLAELLETEFAAGTVTAVNGNATLTVSGGAGIWGASATHKPCWIGRKIQIQDGGVWTAYTINTIADTGATLTLTVNYAGTGGAGLAYKIGTIGQKVRAPDGFPILRYHRLVKTTDGSEYLVAFTKAHAYYWHSAWSAFILKFTSSTCTMWSTVSFKNQIISTNGIDKIQAWGTTIGDASSNLTGSASGINIGGSYLTAANHLYVFEGFVIAADVVIGGTHLPFQMNWCTWNNEADWNQTGAGNCGDLTINEGGRYRGFGEYGGFLVIAKENQMRRAWLVTTSEVINQDTISGLENVGCLAPETIKMDRDGRLYWMDQDYNIREMRLGVISKPKDKAIKNINPSLAQYSKAYFIAEYNQMLFSVPIGAAATRNNTLLTYDPVGSKWGELSIAVSAFGDYTRQTVLDWATILALYPDTNWADVSGDWLAPVNVVGFPLDLGGDYSGYTYDLHHAEQDDGVAYEGHFVLSTDMLQQQMVKRYGTAMKDHKRLQQAKLFFRRETAGTLDLSIKRDNESNWQAAGSVSLQDNEFQRDIVEADITNFDFRAKHYLLKLGASNRFRFVGIMLGFMPDGER